MRMVNEYGTFHRAQATYQGPYTDRKMALLHQQPLNVHHSSSARGSALYAPSPSMCRVSFLYPSSEAHEFTDSDQRIAIYSHSHTAKQVVTHS